MRGATKDKVDNQGRVNGDEGDVGEGKREDKNEISTGYTKDRNSMYFPVASDP